MERRVVVTGMGVVSPVGNDLNSYWDSLVNGRSGIGMITRFDTTDYKVKIAAEVKDFDPLQYLAKPELRKTDLYSQYAIAAAAQAMEDSGIQGKVAPERLGVYVGSGIGGIITTVTEVEKSVKNGPRRVSPYMIPMMIGNMATGMIAMRHNAQGPSLPVVTACATSTNAVGEAYRAIRYGYADAIIAGGTEAPIVGIAVAGFTSCMALSTNPDPATACRPFDKNRDGFIMGEGAAVLILEEYQHALDRGARIYGEVAGYGNTNDAYHMTAPHPEGRGAAEAIRQAAQQAGITSGEGLYINAHGTSTPLNDKGETLAIKLALGEEAARKAAISSTKSMTGHMLGATGAAEAIASLMAIYNGIVPPTVNLVEPDEECDLDYTPLTARKMEVTAALSTSLGFGGHNGCLAFKKIGKE
ncbi:MAG TPA: beta-ketoacyl-ACP synthase II [Firmicutes bacterium]|nr:beta-ketoacyl-ACP synthase II [Bacillota bacterium]